MVRPFDAQLQDLHGFQGRGARILSLYLRTHPAAGDTAALLEQLYAVTRRLRQSVSDGERPEFDADLELARDYISSMVAPPFAVAIFASSRRNYFRVVRLPVDVAPAVHWSALPETAPLRKLAERREELHYSGMRETVPL
jgi:hypothetical protein